MNYARFTISWLECLVLLFNVNYVIITRNFIIFFFIRFFDLIKFNCRNFFFFVSLFHCADLFIEHIFSFFFIVRKLFKSNKTKEKRNLVTHTFAIHLNCVFCALFRVECCLHSNGQRKVFYIHTNAFDALSHNYTQFTYP